MTENIVLTAELRNSSGTGAARALRKEGKIPAIIYGGKDQKAISLSNKEFLKEYEKSNIFSKIIEMNIDKKVIKLITREVQMHPVKDVPMHVDFQEIVKGMVVKTTVTVKVINKEKCPGIKKGGVLNIVHRTIEFSCPPEKIPPYIEVNIEGYEIGDNIHIEDLNLPKELKPIEKGNFTVITIAGRTADSAETEKTEEEQQSDEETDQKSEESK